MTEKKITTFTDENWVKQPLFIVQIPDTEMATCGIHGEWCPNAFYSPAELAEMLMETGRYDCPYCMLEMCGSNDY